MCACTCTHDDPQVCEGAYDVDEQNPQPLCIKAQQKAGWLRLIIAIAIPFGACSCFILLLQLYVRRRQERNLQNLAEIATRLRAERKEALKLARRRTVRNVQWGTSRALDLTGRCNSLSGGRAEGRSVSRPVRATGCSGPPAVNAQSSNESASDSQTSPNSQSQGSRNQGGRRTRFTLEIEADDAQSTRSTEDVELFLSQPDVSSSGPAVGRVTPVQSSVPEDVEMGGAAGMESAVRAAQRGALDVSSPDSQQLGSQHGVRSAAVDEPSQLTTQSSLGSDDGSAELAEKSIRSQLSSASDDSSDDLPDYTHTPQVRVSEISGEL